MYMSEDEIAREYRLARKQKTQIMILAELNQCSKKDIVNILVKKGEIQMESNNKSGVADKVSSPVPDYLIDTAKERLRQLNGMIKEINAQYEKIRLQLEETKKEKDALSDWLNANEVTL